MMTLLVVVVSGSYWDMVVQFCELIKDTTFIFAVTHLELSIVQRTGFFSWHKVLM